MSLNTLIAAFLLLGPLADADVVRLGDGSQLKGNVEEVVLKTDGRHKILLGEDVASVTVTGMSKATVVLKDGKKVSGEITSIRLRGSTGTRTIAGSKVRGVQGTGESIIAPPSTRKKPKPVTSKDEEDGPKTTNTEQEKLHALNKSLYDTHHETVETIEADETATLKAEYQPKIDKVVEVANKVNKTIQDKIRERERRDKAYREELRRYNNERRRDGNNSSRYRRRAPVKPRHNDGLERDQHELASIRSAGIKLKRIISGKKNTIERDAESRQDRLKQVYYWHKKKISAGEVLTKAEMNEKYDQALTIAKEK